MPKKYLVITLKAGRQIKRELEPNIKVPIGSDCMHIEHQLLCYQVATVGFVDTENSTPQRLLYIVPAMINTVEVISE